jgi:hypothetical protein
MDWRGKLKGVNGRVVGPHPAQRGGGGEIEPWKKTGKYIVWNEDPKE